LILAQVNENLAAARSHLVSQGKPAVNPHLIPPGPAGPIDPEEALALLGVDSTIVRAHQHTAGARKDGLGSL
jgi:hypothetical protein